MWERNLPHVRDWPKALRVRHVNLFFAMVFSLAGAVAIAIAAAWLLAPRLNVGTDTTPPAELTRIALAIAAGVGGVVALVVAYRRQRDLEQGRFIEGFGAAAKQLGDADVAVRLAGVYAMAGVADQASKLKRQQCIDVLCSYLRLPYSPELGNNHQSSLLLKKPVRRKGGFEEEHTFQYRQNDREVRQTIVRVIVAHLQKNTASSWSSYDFDFTGAHLEDSDFGDVTFSGKITAFRGATFSGEETFFAGATFGSESTYFDEATFSARSTHFNGATFSSENTSFSRAAFGGNVTGFTGATFRGENTHFTEATFSSVDTSFTDATFSGQNSSFRKATFSGEETWFVGATFSGEFVWIDGATFAGSDTSFAGATFSGEHTSFTETTFSSGSTSFAEATFSGQYIWFDGATFSSGITWFTGATFSGQNTSFLRVDFGDGRVSFNQPKVWNPPPTFDWDTSLSSPATKPASVEPQDWPPLVAQRQDLPPVGAERQG